MGAYQTFVDGNVLDAADLNTTLQINNGTSYTPTWGGAVTIGNGVSTGSYQDDGKQRLFAAKLVLGTTSTIGSAAGTVTMPTGNAAGDFLLRLVVVRFIDASTLKPYKGEGGWPGSATTITFYYLETTSVDGRGDNLSSTAPFTWADPDEIHVFGLIELA